VSLPAGNLSHFQLRSTYSFIQCYTYGILNDILVLWIEPKLSHLVAAPHDKAFLKELLHPVILFKVFLERAYAWDKIVIVLIKEIGRCVVHWINLR